VVDQRLKLLHGLCPIAVQHSPLQETEEALDLPLGLSITRQVGEKLDIQFPQDTPYLRLH
jgi:hypothetical protein